MPEKITREAPMLDVRAAFVPASFDEDSRTVDFVASTGARGLRRRLWGEDYYEELDVSDSAIRMDRLNNGAPFLNSHSSWDVSDVLGVVERAWVENSALMIRVKFSQREEVAPILQDIRDGVLRHVSVGYFVHKYEITEQSGELDVYRATDWEPAEVSLVPIGFDDAAVARSGEAGTQVQLIMARGAQSKEVDMTDEARSEAPEENQPAAVVEERAIDTDAIAQQAIQQERSRVAEIRKAVRTAKLDDSFADNLIETGASIDAARATIIDQIGRQDTSEETSTVRASVDHDVVADMRGAAVEAILHRGGVAQPKEGNPFVGMSLLRLCEDLLARQGVSTRGLGAMEIASRALSTSDLANIAGAVFNKTLLQGYESAPRTFVGVFRQASANDFRAVNRVRLSGAPALEEVREGGEFKYGKVTDEKETYALSTFGKILPFTRQTVINDDMDALVRVPMMFGRSAADLESDIVWGIVIDNDALSDGVALFHADHSNLGSGANISVTSVGAARAAMRAQTGMEGRVINVMPRHLIVGADSETELDQFLTTITPATTANAVPTSMQRLNPVVEPRLTGNAWYIAADFNQVDTIEYCYLGGNAGVYIETREGFNVDGIEIKARHDFAAKAIDYRGLFKNPGA